MSNRSELTAERVRAAWGFLIPMLIVITLVAGWPLLRTIWFSFTDARLSSMGEWSWIGLENYYWLVTDPIWWNAVWNTFYFAIISVALETVLGMIIALAVDRSFPGRGLMRAAMLVPWAIPTIVSAQMWGWMYHDVYGVINHVLMALGIIEEQLAWTADQDLSMWAIIIADVWKTTPFMALLSLAALQMLPGECYEQAKIDGINPVKVFFKVTLPLIRPALMVALIFRTLDALRMFDLVFILTSNSRDTMMMSVYARQQLVDFQDVGFGSAASALTFLIIAGFTVLYIVLGRVNLSGEGGR